MKYTREITRSHRGAFVIAIDQSSSMQERMLLGERIMTKADAVAVVTARLIDELVVRARRDDGVRDYYDLAVIGYSSGEVYPLLGEEPVLMPVPAVAASRPERISMPCERILPSGGRVQCEERITAWIEPRAVGDTPMYEAFVLAHELLDRWCANPANRDSFPPVVFNITDGEPTDSNWEQLRQAARQLCSLSTSDGNVLLFNIHICSGDEGCVLVFPRRDEIEAEWSYARLLADISSTLPDSMSEDVRCLRGDFSQPPYLAMSYNASIAEVVAMLNIGSRSITRIR